VRKKQVDIGELKIGGDSPILLQSMTSTSTMDTQATVEQVIRIVDSGAHLVRITAQNVKEAQNLALIKNELRKRSYHIPLVADIHFSPKAAEIAATIVDKVRINPGNYVDKKKGKTEWTDKEYQNDLDSIKDKIKGLVNICKANKTVIRIGVNHGSLSDRIIYKYGDTVEGMVESAMEFFKIFQDLDFADLIVSLKASNVLVMVEANRQLHYRMKAEGFYFPIHLGVTEAGDAEDARIKSAIGIGALLSEGIGDTIRVSLTEEPEIEIPVAKKIEEAAKENPFIRLRNNHLFSRRESFAVDKIGNKQVPVVIQTEQSYHFYHSKADYIFQASNNEWLSSNGILNIKECSIDALFSEVQDREQNYFVRLSLIDLTKELKDLLKKEKAMVLVLEKGEDTSVQEIQKLIQVIDTAQITCPLVLHLHSNKKDLEDLMIHSSVQAGKFLMEGKLDGLWMDSSYHSCTEIAFGILQASRARISKTEYIACPSCGRTLFNIQEKLKEIKKNTQQFKGLKIAIMGCIVNGPGEMADADYGYVGAGVGKVDIYKGHEIVKKAIPENQATQVLLDIIKADL